MHLKVKEASEEIETWYLDLLITVCYGLIHKVLGLKHPLSFIILVYGHHSMTVGVATHHRDDVQTVGVLVGGKLKRGLREVFRRHNVVLMIHSQDPLPQQLVIDGGSVQILDFLSLLDVLECNLVLLNCHITICTVQVRLVTKFLKLSPILLVLSIDQYLQKVAKYLNALFDLALDQIQHALRKIFVELEPFRAKVRIDGTFQVEVSLIKVLIMQAKAGNLKKSITRIDLTTIGRVILHYLLKVKNGLVLYFLANFLALLTRIISIEVLS